MRYLSVCSGIEAASVAWHPLGWTPVGFSDIDPFPRALLQQRFGAVPVDFDEHRYSPQSNVLPLFGDFTQIQEHHVGPVDLLVGGTPCQSFSVAGKRLGLDDPRGNLAIEFLALAKRVRARWLAWENVPGVLSSWSGDAPDAPDMDAEPGRSEWTADLPETGDFHAFLELFRECGYRGCFRVLDAQFVRVAGLERAVPQRRRRVFVVGHLGDDARALPVLFDRESLQGNPAPRRQAGQGFARDTVPSLTGSSVGARRAGESRGQDPVIAERLAFGGNNTAGPIDVATAVRAHGTQHGDFESETFISEAITFPQNLSGTQDVGEADVSVSLQSKNPTAVAFSCKDSGQDATDDVAPTVQAHQPNPEANTFSGVTDGWAVRRLTPRECERLQGFPDDWTLIPYGSKTAIDENQLAYLQATYPGMTLEQAERLAADAPRYKAIGNSMAVNVMRWVGMRIDFVDKLMGGAPE